MNLEGKKILIVGAGKSGIAAAGLLREKKISYMLYDGNEKLVEEELRRMDSALETCPICLGELKEEWLTQTDLAVLSPGVPIDLPVVCQMRERGIPIWGEIELAYHFAKGRLLAITGTNGKTTTTSLLGEIMREYYQDVRVVGNIGTPYTSVAGDTSDETVVVAEISSFQLETAIDFHPQVSAILNITPDHLNRHHTMERYIETKESITKNQSGKDTCVLNYEDEVLRAFGETLDYVVFFSSRRPLKDGFFYEDGKICRARDGKVQVVTETSKLQVLGLHNYENVMAAAAMAEAFGVPMDVIARVLERFRGVEHRIEYVTEKCGVAFYNDSKGTNVDAAIQGIKAMNRPTFLIGGGYDKESEYDDWIEAFDGKVKRLVLIGQTREKIAACAKKHGFDQITFADSLEEAVDVCYENAVGGDAVLLSPACASWGMFDNYEQRGEIFKEYVRSLKE